MGMGHITPAINKVLTGHGTYRLYVPCPCGTLFIAGVICPILM
jgi:hypothetical protein